MEQTLLVEVKTHLRSRFYFDWVSSSWASCLIHQLQRSGSWVETTALTSTTAMTDVTQCSKADVLGVLDCVWPLLRLQACAAF